VGPRMQIGGLTLLTGCVVFSHTQHKSINTIPEFNVMNRLRIQECAAVTSLKTPSPQQQHNFNLKSRNNVGRSNALILNSPQKI
jgi:hypothetical protein